MRTPRLLVLLLMLSLPTVAPIAVAQTRQQLVEQANAAQATGNYAQAQAIWRQVLQREPNNADIAVAKVIRTTPNTETKTRQSFPFYLLPWSPLPFAIH